MQNSKRHNWWQRVEDRLALYRAVSLLFGVVCPVACALELLRLGSVVVGELPGSAAYAGTLGLLLAVGGAALVLPSWLRRRVCRVVGSEAGRQLLGRPGRAMAWSEVASVSKDLLDLLSGFYLLRLVEGTEVYSPIEREVPAFATSGTWAAAPTAFEQRCRQHQVWVGQAGVVNTTSARPAGRTLVGRNPRW